MVRSKKGSLSLSINAIVILVLAITMLGLGLAFTKGMFGKLSSKLSVPEPDIPATADDPIVLPVDEMQITKNKEFIFSVNFYNDGFSYLIVGKLVCPPKDAPSGSSELPAQEILICSSPQKVPTGDDKGFKFILAKENVGQSSTRVCTIGFALDGTSGGEGLPTEQIMDCATNIFPEDAITKQIVVTVR